VRFCQLDLLVHVMAGRFSRDPGRFEPRRSRPLPIAARIVLDRGPQFLPIGLPEIRGPDWGLCGGLHVSSPALSPCSRLLIVPSLGRCFSRAGTARIRAAARRTASATSSWPRGMKYEVRLCQLDLLVHVIVGRLSRARPVRFEHGIRALPDPAHIVRDRSPVFSPPAFRPPEGPTGTVWGTPRFLAGAVPPQPP
jgi:hypothetical protein